MSKLGYWPPLILLACAAAFYLGSRDGFDGLIPEVPERDSPEEPSQNRELLKDEKPPAISAHERCMERSDEIYRSEVINFIRIEKLVGVGRFQDDMHGKGLNRITRERLEREEQCQQN